MFSSKVCKCSYPLFFGLAFLLFSINGKAQSFSSPVEYLDFLGNYQTEIAKKMWNYTSAVARGKKDSKIEAQRSEVVASIEKTIQDVKKAEPYQGDTQLKDSLLSYLELSHIVMEEEYSKIMDMEAIAEQSYDNMEAYLLAKEIAEEKINAASQRINLETEKYAEKHEILLTEDRSKLSQNLETAGLVFDHYNEVYLIFFKAYKQESYLIEAQESGDVNAMEQNGDALKSISEEGIEKLKQVKSYNNDGALKLACRKQLDFYKKYGEKSLPVLTDFYLKKEKFEKIKVAMESKKKKDVTQEDVDKYNGALEEYNQAVNDYNNTNQQLNEERSRLLNEWNKTAERYLDKHVPRG